MTKGQGGQTLYYDAENKLVQYQEGAAQSGGANYSYDGDGRRVKKATPAETLIFVYNISGQLVAEYTTSTTQNNGTSYLTSDTLGSPRVNTKADGSVRARHDYLPFGEELYANTGSRTTGQKYDDGASPLDKTRQKFTQKERDRETGLDYFLARYYSSTQGRFTGVDPEQEGARNDDPQSWNGYAYTGCNPIVRTDPDGKKYLVCDSEGNGCVEYSDDDFWSIRRANDRDYGFTGNRDFYESGSITQNGETIATYVQISIDDPVREFSFQMRRQTAPIGKATAAFFGISLVAGATGGSLVYALTPASVVTTLGLTTRVAPVAAGVLDQLGRTDASIFQRAAQYGASAANSFVSNLQALTQATAERIPGGQLNRIGQIGNSPIYGSLRSGVEIAEVDGVTVIVKMVRGNPQVLGPLP